MKRVAESQSIALRNIGRVCIEEVFRLGVLRDGVRLTTSDIRLPILGQVIPRIELIITAPESSKKITVRINQESPFTFDGNSLRATINGEGLEVACIQYLNEDRAPTGIYDFGILRENGMRSFVFDYHTYCAYSCNFCFKESEWEVLSIQQANTSNYKANHAQCLRYVEEHADEFRTNYDIVWLCTGSITNETLELERHQKMARALRGVGYTEGIYVSQVIPPGILRDRGRRRDYMHALKDSGVSRFNSGVEVVGQDYRKRYIHGYKGTITFEDFLAVFEDAGEIFGGHGVGSCLLAGLEPSENTMFGLEQMGRAGVAPAPTVFTPFVVKQQSIPFMYDLDELIEVHLKFNEIIEKYGLPEFSGVFSLA
ncbi:radical SAM protein [Streptomyces sioyaensis]|uniref:radical SAM protein n=1 Tax=Streptomyces sioyaensis TaxID=67364 RepID=UPI0037D32770